MHKKRSKKCGANAELLNGNCKDKSEDKKNAAL